MTFTLRKVLALDSIRQYLHFTERIAVHRFILDYKTDTAQLPLKVRQALNLIKKHEWKCPELRIDADRVLKYWDDGNLVVIENYKHEILTELNTLK